MTDKGIRTISDELQSLYRPQTDQLGMKLHHRAGGLEGRVNNRTFRGRVWVSAVDPYCLVVWHDLIFFRDQEFSEFSPTKNACLILDESTGPTKIPVSPQPYVQQGDDSTSLLRSAGPARYLIPAGTRSRSRSITILPGYFINLERTWRGQFSGLSQAFTQPWEADAIESAQAALALVGPDSTTGAGLLLKSRIDTLLALLAKNLVADRDPPPNENPTSSDRDLAQQTMIYIRDHLDQDLSIDRLSRILYVSRTHLCQVFSDQVGMGLAQYTRWLRMNIACHLLTATGGTIQQICQQVGYGRASTFTAAFTREVGVSPTTWRAQHTESVLSS